MSTRPGNLLGFILLGSVLACLSIACNPTPAPTEVVRVDPTSRPTETLPPTAAMAAGTPTLPIEHPTETQPPPTVSPTTLPRPTETQPPTAAPLQCAYYHQVSFGETVSGIAQSYGITVQMLMTANQLSSSLISVGQRLCIPEGASAPIPSAAEVPQPTETRPPTLVPPYQYHPPLCGYWYTVRWGDTLSSISYRTSVSAWAIAQANNIVNPSYIYAGMQLWIPCGAASNTPTSPQPAETRPPTLLPPPATLPMQPSAGTPLLIAQYPLADSANDATGNYGPITVQNAPFQEGGVYCNGVYVYSNQSNPCLIQTPLLDNLNLRSFSIAARFKADDARKMPVFVGGNSARWMAFYLLADGQVGLLYNNQNFQSCTGRYTPNTWHQGLLTYDGTTGRLYLDRQFACSADFDIVDKYGDKNVSTTNYSNGAVFKGVLSNLQVFNGVVVP